MSEPVKNKSKMSSTDSLILCLANEIYRDGKTCQVYVQK